MIGKTGCHCLKYFLKNIWRVSSGAQGCQMTGGLRVQMCCIPSLVWSSGLSPDFTNRVNSPFSLSKSCLWFVFSQETVCFVLINYVSENLPLVSVLKPRIDNWSIYKDGRNKQTSGKHEKSKTTFSLKRWTPPKKSTIIAEKKIGNLRSMFWGHTVNISIDWVCVGKRGACPPFQVQSCGGIIW